MKYAKKYIPNHREWPSLAMQKESAWGNIPTIIRDIIERFNIGTEKAIEFGVEYGYSTSALSNYFKEVVGVDIFTGDMHAGFKGDIFEETKNYLRGFTGIKLVKDSYQNYISNHEERYNFAHVDIIHTYNDTYVCGEWCVNHADVTVFHDTLSFPDVYRACEDLAKNYDLDFYNYEESYGLGILVKRQSI
jgi:hypothetical protein